RDANGTIDAHVQRSSSETRQKRLAEKRGFTTAVAPAQRVASMEYACAFVWKSGSVTMWTSSGRRSWCAALTRAPHSAFAWVQSTPFGREVVPDVYCTENGAIGSCGRAGRRSGSASIASNDSSAAGAYVAGAARVSVAVTASQRRRGQAAVTTGTSRGCVMPATTAASSANQASSSALERALVVTATAPSQAQPNQARIASGQLSRCTR